MPEAGGGNAEGADSGAPGNSAAGANAGGNYGRGGAHSAGAHSGGATGYAGKASICDLVECFVANTCLNKCGGSVVYTGCCACEPPSVNRLTCMGTD